MSIRSKLQNFMDEIDEVPVTEGDQFTYHQAGDLRAALRSTLREYDLGIDIHTNNARMVGESYIVDMIIEFHELDGDETLEYHWVGGGRNSDAGKSISTAQTNGLKSFLTNNFLAEEAIDGDDDQSRVEQGGSPAQTKTRRESASDASRGEQLFGIDEDEQSKSTGTASDKQLNLVEKLISKTGAASDGVEATILKTFDADSIDELDGSDASHSIAWLKYVLPDDEERVGPDDNLDGALQFLPDCPGEVREKMDDGAVVA